MTRRDKILDPVLRGSADAGIRLDDIVAILERLGFDERVRGDHHIFSREGKAKPYQVKQVRRVVTSYGLVPADTGEEHDT